MQKDFQPHATLLFYNQRYRTGGQLDRESERTFWRGEKYTVPAEDLPTDLSSTINIE
jgi:hypothetical protein